MTDDIPTPKIDMDAFMARYRAYEQRAAELHPANKAALFAALADAGITRVTVTFNGYGDSGQIDSITVRAGEEEVELPATSVELASTEFGSEEITRLTKPLADAVDSFCYALLADKHGGWENNEGAYGEFVFDVATDRIVLDFNYRIETSENHIFEL